MKDEVETNINICNKDHIVVSCDTLGITVPEAQQNLPMSSPTLTKDNTECVGEKDSHHDHDNCEDSSEHVQSSEYINYYDNEIYALEQLKTDFPEDLLPQSDCSVNSKIHSEELLKFVAKAEIKDKNTEDGLSLNIKEENDYNEYQFIVKTEGLEEQENVQCEFPHKTLKNGDFIEQDLVEFAEKHPGVVVYLKPRRHRSPVIVAEYLNGDRVWMSVHNKIHSEITKWVEVLRTQQGDVSSGRLRKYQYTDYPSVQGPWTPFTFKAPELNVAELPDIKFGANNRLPISATEQLRLMFEKQKLQGKSDEELKTAE